MKIMTNGKVKDGRRREHAEHMSKNRTRKVNNEKQNMEIVHMKSWKHSKMETKEKPWTHIKHETMEMKMEKAELTKTKKMKQTQNDKLINVFIQVL